MIIKLNDKPYEVIEGTSLSVFLDELNISKEGIAIAIEYKVIPKSEWKDAILIDQQELMLIHAVSGG
ncbi:MAG: sulfur carrier protein ThiS [Tannerellaceae bacterium]|nr:sulfur carrier protein ThiS [Tannerellaceae bacterium]